MSEGCSAYLFWIKVVSILILCSIMNDMKLKIVTIGEPKLFFAKEGFGEYIKRLGAFHKIDVVYLKDGVRDEKILSKIGNSFFVVLDEHGKEFSSRGLAQFLDKKALESVGEMSFLIGGPDGHSDVLRERAEYLWSFGKLTFPHDMAMVILAEALYRASTINANHPYHRE